MNKIRGNSARPRGQAALGLKLQKQVVLCGYIGRIKGICA
jgi:hypothetical protein